MIPEDRAGEFNPPAPAATSKKEEAPKGDQQNELLELMPASPVALPAQSAEPPKTPVTPPSAIPQTPEPKKADVPPEITKILAGIKLPERRDAEPAQHGAEKKAVVYDTSLIENGQAQTKEPPGTDVPQPIPAPEPQQSSISEPSSTPVSSLRTLKNDVQHAVRDQNISVVRAAAYEQDKRNKERPATTPLDNTQMHRQRTGVLIASLISFFLLSGFAALLYVYLSAEEGRSVAETPVDSSLVFAERTIPLSMDTLSDVDIKRYISQALNITDAPLSSITRILPTNKQADDSGATREVPATVENFLQSINAPAPPELLRSFKGDFFLGMHAIDKNVPLFIIPITSYERAFAGMLKWEETLNADMLPIFTPVPRQQIDENGLLIDRTFKDLVIKNYDVRALIDDSGNIQLLYSFPTRNMLIITESPNSFIEILSRLRANGQL